MLRAAQLLREHLSVFGNGEGGAAQPAIQITSAEEQQMLDTLALSVNELELSVRAVNCLNTAQIRVLGELVDKTEAEMLKYRNFGKKSLQEIKLRLAERGLSLGMTLKDEIREALQQKLAARQEED